MAHVKFRVLANVPGDVYEEVADFSNLRLVWLLTFGHSQTSILHKGS